MKKSTGLAGMITAAVLLVGAPVVVTGAHAADAVTERAQRAIETRQGALKLLGFYMGPLGAMARGRIPMDVKTVERHADRIASIAPILGDTFRFDTSQSGVASDALPVIWTKPNEFAAKGETLLEKASELGRLARAGDEGAIKGGIGGLGQACGSCHEDFRVDDN